jgi:hypothetical protein
LHVAAGVVDDFMLVVLKLESLIGEKRIGVYRAVLFDILADVLLDNMLAASRNHCGTEFSATLNQSDNGSLVFCPCGSDAAVMLFLVHIPRCPADESLVHFNFFAVPADFQKRIVLHCKPNPVEHEPCRLLSDAQCPSEFIRADSIFAVGDHPHSNKPLVEGQRRILKDCPDLSGKLPFRMDALALPLALISEEHRVFPPTSWAFNAARPAQLDHVREAVVRIPEMQDGLLECLGLFHVSHLPQDYLSRSDLSSILSPL